MDGRAQLAESAKPLLAQMNDSIFKDLLLEKLSELVGMSPQKLQQRITSSARDKYQPTASPARRSDRHVRQNSTRTAIALLLQFPELAKTKPVPEEFSSSELEGFSLLAELYSHTTQNAEITSVALLERFRGNQYENSLLKLMEWEFPGVEEEQQRNILFIDSMNSLIKKHRHQRYEILSDKQSLTTEEKQEYLSLLSD